MSSQNAQMPPVASTGVGGLDAVLGGGFPRGEMHLVQGTAGTGKTTIGLSYSAKPSPRARPAST